LKPVVDGLKGEYGDKIEFKEINFYDNRELANKYKAPGHPTLVITRPDGTAVKVLPGVSERSEIEQALKEALQ
jgi:thioredoxin-related protein